jgi:predicted PurR-regulated permease PerM
VLGLVALVLIMWAAPTVPVMLLGGFAVAMALSFPVRWLSSLMPRRLAILSTFLLMIGAVIVALLFLVPVLIAQLAAFVSQVPGIARSARDTLRGVLEPLSDRGLLQETPDQFMAKRGQAISSSKSVSRCSGA